ncbi:hypothetical protein [Methanoplanus endosymbiosus]|uniref:Uncharacterized protein n=1 Tax=Methanoplanus endosymbiosus TaxID=33865 RepID=A0A9E7TJQ9_9EURY|nr:hypothetical protein [Methanoplanus endosymbiosus]UUX92069.1 hypothetical protein L6E24_12000 [Methanoplanus endosymbiosus]
MIGAEKKKSSSLPSNTTNPDLEAASIDWTPEEKELLVITEWEYKEKVLNEPRFNDLYRASIKKMIKSGIIVISNDPEKLKSRNVM